MKSKILWWILGGLGVFFFLSSLAITFVEYNRFNARPVAFPPGSTIAGVPVGGLDQEAAEARLAEFYNLPLVLEINRTTIHAAPGDLGFSINGTTMVQEAAQQIESGDFWAHLWNRDSPVPPVEVPLLADVDESQVLAYLNSEIATRYSQPGTPVTPIVWTTNFNTSQSGEHLDLDQALDDIRTALQTPEAHHVDLHLINEPETAPDWEMLKAFLRHNINWIGFDNLIEVYLESMDTGQTLHFALQDNALVEPGIAFPAASTNKIPIMISVLRRTTDPTPEEVVNMLYQMVALSENPPADTLMSAYLDEVRGPLVVTEDMIELGMENTILGAFFAPGGPFLELFVTPANTRNDIFLDPDAYNQTIPAEAGKLLSAIYACASDEPGLLTETFPGEITPSECQLMVDTLASNKIGLLIEGGVPHGATVAHKHGWATDLDGQIRFMSDVGIVFTDGGDYVLNVFIHDPTRLNFDDGNRLITRLSQTVYNFFNIENQAHWWFD